MRNFTYYHNGHPIEMTHEYVEQVITDLFPPKERSIKLYTGVGGKDLYDESFESARGYKRVNIGKKVPRILRQIKTICIHKSVRGIYYKLVRK